MADIQKRLTESFSVRKTRSQSKSMMTKLRTRNVSTRLFNLENADGKESKKELDLGSPTSISQDDCNLRYRKCLTSKAKKSTKFLTGHSTTGSKIQQDDSPIRRKIQFDDSTISCNIEEPCARRNLASLFDNCPDDNSGDVTVQVLPPGILTPKKTNLNFDDAEKNESHGIKSPRRLALVLTPVKNTPTDNQQQRSPPDFVTPRKSLRHLTPKKENSPCKQLISNFRTPRKLGCVLSLTAKSPMKACMTTPKKATKTPPRDQENYLSSPNKSPKRHNTENLRLVATSPHKRKKVSTQKCNVFTPVSLFKQDVSSYRAAKNALHSSTPSRLVSRERQIKDLQEFLEEHLISGGQPGSLYVSGAPGTGKTACLEKLLFQLKETHNFNSIFVNCMTVNQSSDIFEKILTGLGGKKGSSNKENIKKIEKLICKKKQMIVLVLDEMDQLSSKNQTVLYSIFDWPRLPSSNLILIGIANSLDMTDRILPRLHTCGSQLTLLHFPPYSQTQITAILEDRLKDLIASGDCIIKPMALQFCARKIAAQTGDIRKALNTCRRAVELVEKSVRSQQVLRATADDGCNPGSPRRSPRKLTSQTVEVKHIMNILHEIYGSRLVSSNASKSDVETSMPVQQKLLLCTLLLLTKHKQKHKGRDLTLGKLHEVYTKVCRLNKVENLPSAEFQSVCLLVETNGLLQIKKHKEARLSKVVLNVDEDELQFVMKDRSLLSSVLEDESVLKGIH